MYASPSVVLKQLKQSAIVLVHLGYHFRLEMSLPTQYRALQLTKSGAPLAWTTLPLELPSSDQLLVRVHFCGLNRKDGFIQRLNIPSLRLPVVLGYEFSGVVVAAGSAVQSSVHVGQHVFGVSGGGGCLAEYYLTDSTLAFAYQPTAQLSERVAATLGVAYCTAYEAMVEHAQVDARKGQVVLIQGAAGACGSMACIIAQRAGLTVIGSASLPANLTYLRSTLQLAHTIDYKQQDVAEQVVSLTGERGADLVWDSTMSPASFPHSAAAVAEGGTWLRLGRHDWRPFVDAASVVSVVHARRAMAEDSDWQRYFDQPDYQPHRTRVFRAACEDAVGAADEGRLHVQLLPDVPFDAQKVQSAIDVIADGNRQGGRVVVDVVGQSDDLRH